MFPKVARLRLMEHIRNNPAFGGPTFTYSVGLVKTDPAPADEDVEVPDMDPADFDGFAFVTPTFGAPVLDGSDRAKSVSATVTFTAGAGIAAPQTIYGLFILWQRGGEGFEIFQWYRFSTPIVMNSPGDVIERIITLYDTDLAI